MTLTKTLVWSGLGLLALVMGTSGFAQGNRSKAEIKTGSGAITVEYGRPSLKGRDMLSQLQVGSFWRMGSNQAAVLTTPVDLAIGPVKVSKGSYSLWLKKAAADKYELVFNSQVGQWGTEHDPKRDVYSVPLQKETLPNPVEIFTIDLKETAKGGEFSLSWGPTKLLTPFQFAK